MATESKNGLREGYNNTSAQLEVVPFIPRDIHQSNRNGSSKNRQREVSLKRGPFVQNGQQDFPLLYTRTGLMVPDSESNRQSDVIPFGVDHYFVDGSPTKGIDFAHLSFQAVDHYIDDRLETFIIRANERNRALLEEKPFLKELLSKRINQRTSMIEEDISEDMLLQELSDHMVNDNVIYQDADGIYYLPYNDIHPNDEAFRNKRFGWDTEMHVAAILGSKLQDKTEIAKDSMRNAKYLFDVLGYVPNGAARALDDRTQPARHTRTLRMIYDAMIAEERQLPENQEFFVAMWSFAAREYWEVFHPKDPQLPPGYSSKDRLHQNIVDSNGVLHQRYGSLDEAVYHDLSACGSGRDFSLDTVGREADHTRIDMQTDLYACEEDFAWWEKTNNRDEKPWTLRMEQRERRVMENHYDPQTQWFYHYDFKNGRLGTVAPVTGILVLRMINDPKKRAGILAQFEAKFVHGFGIGLTDPDTLPKLTPEKEEAIKQLEPDPGMQQTIKEQYVPGQWDGDNQFYNITKHVVDELRAAGEDKLAIRVMEGALIGLVRYFQIKQVINGHGKLAEKINSRNGVMGNGAKYGDQDELAMPMGLFKLFMKDLPGLYVQAQEREKKVEKTEIYIAPERRIRKEKIRSVV